MYFKTIAETAWHHDGDYVFMRNLIDDIIKYSKADVIKLHISIDLDEYMCEDHPSYSLLKEKMLKEEEWHCLIEKINSSSKRLMLLFNDTKAVEFGMKYNPSIVEIHSTCLNDIHLLSCIKMFCDRDIEIVLGVGGSTLYEIENAINFLKTKNIILMHGFQNYPTNYKNINFNKIRKIKNLYPEFKHGYADHTSCNEAYNDFITVMGAAIGMDYIEKHVTTDPGVCRTDWESAISIEKFNEIIESLMILDMCNGDGLIKLNEGEKSYSIFGPNKKTAFIRNDVKKGSVLHDDDIAFKRTAKQSDVSQLEIWELFGKKARYKYSKGTMITKI